jgi:hypothetical protein
MVDTKDNVVEEGKDWMRSVEVNGTVLRRYNLHLDLLLTSSQHHYFREQIPYCDDAMAAVMQATDVTDNGPGKFFDPK